MAYKVVLVFTGFYLPGFKRGGPIRTIANMVEALGDEVQFSLVTLDRDLGDSAPYPNIKPNAWQRLGKAQVYYAPPLNSFHQTLKVIRDFQGDILFLNSFFSYRFSILPLLISNLVKPGFEVFVAPRGEFSEGALALKSAKKQVWLVVAKAFGLYKKVTWLASTTHEAEDIRRVMGRNIAVRIAIDIAAPAAKITINLRNVGTPLQVVFISRISPKKNLLGAIEILMKVQCPVDFHVYGPVEDANYWSACQSAASSLPAHVSLQSHGPLQPDAIAQKLAGYDLFLLPTLGENFGHVIAEALSAGLPVLISDQTPWRDMEAKGLGWDIPLGDTEAFMRSIDACHSKSAAEYSEWRQHIRSWALENIGNQEAIEQNRQLFTNLKASDGQ